MRNLAKPCHCCFLMVRLYIAINFFIYTYMKNFTLKNNLRIVR